MPRRSNWKSSQYTLTEGGTGKTSNGNNNNKKKKTKSKKKYPKWYDFKGVGEYILNPDDKTKDFMISAETTLAGLLLGAVAPEAVPFYMLGQKMLPSKHRSKKNILTKELGNFINSIF